MFGGVLSSTVTVAVAVDELPLGSVTVKVTVLSPMSAHVKELGAIVFVSISQLSDDPSSISSAVIV